MAIVEGVEIEDNVFWVGAKDYSRTIFDSLIRLQKGTSYNSYLVIGDNEAALIDTVNPGFEDIMEKRIRSVVEPEKIKYIVMNHAEPDYAGGIERALTLSKGAKLITTQLGSKFATLFYNIPQDRIKVVKEGEKIDLGGYTLSFIEAPMLHWPETMFTFLNERGILFTCDFFGAHTAEGMWSDEVEDIMYHAKKYWGEIMMPFRVNAKNALKKISGLDVKMIAPSHGPIYRRPKEILERYIDWSEGKTKEKVLILFTSMWGHAMKAAEIVASELVSKGVEVSMYDASIADPGDVAAELVDSRGLVVASSTLEAHLHPMTTLYLNLAKLLRPPLKYAASIVTYLWGTGADREIRDALQEVGLELVGEIKINVRISENEVKALKKIAEEMAKKVKG
ncbi:MAG: MBL fold hydrolase [Fervidicoccus sp.]|nr:MAG: MBL fold hydrolase [Fervidicoccus sp.]